LEQGNVGMGGMQRLDHISEGMEDAKTGALTDHMEDIIQKDITIRMEDAKIGAMKRWYGGNATTGAHSRRHKGWKDWST